MKSDLHSDLSHLRGQLHQVHELQDWRPLFSLAHRAGHVGWSYAQEHLHNLRPSWLPYFTQPFDLKNWTQQELFTLWETTSIRNPKLISLHACPLGDEGLLALFEYLHTQNLHTLRLQGCALSAEGARELAEMAQKLPALSHLDLSYNRLRPEGIKALVPLLSQCSLSSLQLHHCGLSGASLRSLQRECAQNPDLSNLQIHTTPLPPFAPEKTTATTNLTWILQVGTQNVLPDAYYTCEPGTEQTRERLGRWLGLPTRLLETIDASAQGSWLLARLASLSPQNYPTHLEHHEGSIPLRGAVADPYGNIVAELEGHILPAGTHLRVTLNASSILDQLGQEIGDLQERTQRLATTLEESIDREPIHEFHETIALTLAQDLQNQPEDLATCHLQIHIPAPNPNTPAQTLTYGWDGQTFLPTLLP